jgi:DNA-binding CsgD family transcriptional regulator
LWQAIYCLNTLGWGIRTPADALYLLEGKSAKEISLVLHLFGMTVEFHKYHMMEMLTINNNAELTQFAIKQGIVTI